MKQHRQIIALTALLALALTSATAFADMCPSYDELTDKLGQRYKEQLLFSGFATGKSAQGATAVYEFWSNSERGNWSLIAHKLLMFQDGDRRVTRDCAFVVASGKRHKLVDKRIDGAYPTSATPTENAPVPGSRSSCITRGHHAHVLAEKYQEQPVVQALADDESLMEIYGAESSWTITRAKVRELQNPMSGMALRDKETGQEIRSLCSRAIYSGQQWGMFSQEDTSI